MLPVSVACAVCIICALALCLPEVKCDESVCSKTVRQTYRSPMSYRVTYREEYKERCRVFFTCRKTRVNSYTSYTTVTKEKYVQVDECCSGYELDQDGCLAILNWTENTAEANMRTSYIQVRWYQCRRLICLPPSKGCKGRDLQFYTGSERKLCNPVCTRPCVNSQCTKPNKCECSDGYVLSDELNVCQPSCPDCINGRCVQPDVCECNFGFTKSDAGDCVPVCTEPCINGFCTAPETCVCHPGFRRTAESNQCKPYCSSGCENGSCVGPETCRCDDGYTLVEDRCLPVCQGCVNGQCVKPGVCRCYIGFHKNQKGFCSPQCDRCENGTCVAPGNCTCNKGYIKNIQDSCVPHCKDGCQNGICSATDICTCNPGYNKKLGKCLAICDRCENSNCTAPGVCACFEGFEFAINSTQRCIPICKPNCSKNENCLAPNNCSCLTGFKKIKDKCQPHCSSCSHGTCSAPEKCSCSKGYKHPANAIDRCVPICKLGCENGTCIAPDKCVCAKGYRNMRGTCFPFCNNCINGDCVSPGKCICLEGYQFETNSTQMCVAKCKDGCPNGICIEPDVCVCDVGYLMDESNRCKPKCSQCDSNAICVAPGKCECLPGYKTTESNSSCIPDCDEGCGNNTTCRLGCVNGTCSLPGACVCGCGFITKVFDNNNTYCVLGETSQNNCSKENDKIGDNMELQKKSPNTKGSLTWVYVGVTAVLVVTLVICISQRRKLMKLTSHRRRSYYPDTSSSIYAVPISVMSDD